MPSLPREIERKRPRMTDRKFDLAVIMTNQENRKEDGSHSIHFSSSKIFPS
jgi:hypothetical protein